MARNGAACGLSSIAAAASAVVSTTAALRPVGWKPTQVWSQPNTAPRLIARRLPATWLASTICLAEGLSATQAHSFLAPLGLSQVFGLAKQSGGGVRIDTQVGEGTSVKVYLPRAAQMVPVAEATETNQRPPTEKGLVSVLVVDDDSAVREVTRNILTDLGYEVVEAGSGGAALEVLGRVDVDIALLDFAMPGMNGAELAKEIRSTRPHMPIVFATGYAAVSALKDESEERIVQKPFDERELFQKLSAALSHSRAEQVMGRRHGLLTNLLVGVVGAFLGALITSALGHRLRGLLGQPARFSSRRRCAALYCRPFPPAPADLVVHTKHIRLDVHTKHIRKVRSE